MKLEWITFKIQQMISLTWLIMLQFLIYTYSPNLYIANQNQNTLWLDIKVGNSDS